MLPPGKLVLKVFSWVAPFIALLSAEPPRIAPFYICAKSLQPPSYVFYRCERRNGNQRAQIFGQATGATPFWSLCLSLVKSDFGDSARSRAITAITRDSGDDLAYNLHTLRKPAGTVL